MKRIKLTVQSELKMKNILGFMKRKVTFGTGAEVDSPKEYPGKTAYLVITEEQNEVKQRREEYGIVLTENNIVS